MDILSGAVPVQSAVWLHRGRLTECSDPTQHILLSVGAEEIGAHSLVHHLVQIVFRFKCFLHNVPLDTHLPLVCFQMTNGSIKHFFIYIMTSPKKSEDLMNLVIIAKVLIDNQIKYLL